jgi:hypothetical protein
MTSSSLTALLLLVQFYVHYVVGQSNRNGKVIGVNITVLGSGTAFAGKPYGVNLSTNILNASKWIIDWGDWTQSELPGEQEENNNFFFGLFFFLSSSSLGYGAAFVVCVVLGRDCLWVGAVLSAKKKKKGFYFILSST